MYRLTCFNLWHLDLIQNENERFSEALLFAALIILQTLLHVLHRGSRQAAGGQRECQKKVILVWLLQQINRKAAYHVFFASSCALSSR